MNVELVMDRRFQPADVAFLQERGPILKFNLCINQCYRELLDLRGAPWRTRTTSPTTILNHRTEFPAAHTWPYLNELFSSVATLIPPEFISDTVSRIFAYAVESSDNPRAAVIYLKAVITVVHPVIARSASVHVFDSVQIVDEAEVTPVDIPRRPVRRSARDLKERYLVSASEADQGDCAVCLEELNIIAGKSSCSQVLKIIAGKSSRSQVLKMPCSHMFHHRCIAKWLKANDTCPQCRAVIP